MFVVLVTDFAAVERVYGPFTSKKEAHNWAFQNLPEVYRVFEVLAPNAAREGQQDCKTSTEQP